MKKDTDDVFRKGNVLEVNCTSEVTKEHRVRLEDNVQTIDVPFSFRDLTDIEEVQITCTLEELLRIKIIIQFCTLDLLQ